MSTKKPIVMSADDFVYQVGLLGGEYKRVAYALGKSQACISLYATGRARIPEAVRDRMQELVEARRAELEKYLSRPVPALADMLQAVNEIKLATAVPSAPKLPGRDNPPDHRTYPSYAPPSAKLRVYVSALRAWAEYIMALYRVTGEEHALRMYKLELADTKALLAAARAVQAKGTPYELCITYTEWQVVSRALRHAGTKEAYSMYQHWRVHRDTGWPAKRDIPLHRGIEPLAPEELSSRPSAPYVPKHPPAISGDVLDKLLAESTPAPADSHSCVIEEEEDGDSIRIYEE